MILVRKLAKPGKPLLLCAAVSVALTGCASFSGDNSLNSDGDSFRKGVYASAGLGASRLDPSTDDLANFDFDVNDRVEPGGQATLGADLTPTFSVELHSADLGSVGFSPAGSADDSVSAGRYNYHMNGASALAYFGKDKYNDKREGFKPYGRLGLVSIRTDNVNNVLGFERTEDAPVIVGAGVEYSTGFGLGVRAEALTNGADTSFGQVGLLYRLGIGSKKKPQLAQAKPRPAPLPKPAPRPVITAKAPVDGDRDGVMDNRDQCLSTPRGVVVDSTGCEAGAAMIDMVLFDHDSAELTATARGILSSVARTVTSNPGSVLNLEGHADATGNSDYNMSLSNRRARNVASYLMSQGVRQSQLVDINHYGESSPAQDNSTNSGRAANRRVEVFGKGIVR